jgi:hypothetical protein
MRVGAPAMSAMSATGPGSGPARRDPFSSIGNITGLHRTRCAPEFHSPPLMLRRNP